LQARRQDFPAGGPKITSGPHFLKTMLDVCSNRGAKHEMGGTYFKWRGRALLAPRWRRPWLFVTLTLAAQFSRKMRKMQHQIESAEQHGMLQYFNTFFGFICSDVPTDDLFMNKLGANRYGKKQTKRLKLCINLVVTSKLVTPSLTTEIESKVSSKALQLCITDSKDFALAVHLVGQKGRNAASVRSKLSLIFSNKSIRFEENLIRLESYRGASLQIPASRYLSVE